MFTQKSNYLLFSRYTVVLLLLCVLFLSNKTQAQCNIQFNNLSKPDTFCVGELIQFRDSIVSFGDIVLWNFGDGNSSTDISPVHKYSSAGTFSVTYAKSNSSGTCRDTITAFILPSPKIGVELLTPSEQCFRGNRFCFTDTIKAPDGNIIRLRHLFSDGAAYDTVFTDGKVRKAMNYTFCHTISDPTGGFYDLTVEAYDENGCISRVTFKDIIFVQPRIGAQFDNITPKPNPGCDSTIGMFENTSLVPLADVDTFYLQWGDGTSVGGNSTVNTEWWEGTNKDGKVSHHYKTHGSFDATLVVSAYGCTDVFTWKDAVANISINPKIVHSLADQQIPHYENPIRFSVENLPPSPGVDAFLWNFGDPPSGPQNFNDITLVPEHTFSLGPHLISLRIIVGPCDVTLLDTIQILGPQALIEKPYNRIDFSEKFQCGTDDSVHFTNNSTFYHNDTNQSDEDSFLVVNGKELLAFNYTLPPGRGGAGTGDQRSLASAAHKANRTLGSQVWRIWDFGDPYAAKCTTSMAKGINVGVNCNWSEDEFPVHKYQSWDSVYYNLYYMTNEKFAFTKYNETTNSCYIEMIDTLSPIVHRRIFDKTIPHKYTAKLWLRDTINHIESSDEILIDHTKPDASKMTLSSGIPCPFDGSSLNYVLNFKLNTGTQSYFAVNLDSLANPTGFIPYNQGLLAPPAPGSPIPFTLPYEITGSLGDEFVKGYTLGEVGNDPKLRKPNGSFTMGLIVGNGPAIGGSPATCLDTVWYNDFFKIKYMNASFDIVSPAADKKTICAGESAYFNITEPIQNDISVLRWSWGYQGIGRGPNLDVYVEQFKYMEPYTGPSPSRNDKNIAYKGEDWYYNYVIRQSIDDLYGYKTLDTIVTAIVKDWKIETKFNYEGSINPFAHGTGYSEIDDRDLYKLWGDGTFGCIDTTGLSGLVSISKKEYRSYNGDAVITHGNRRYRYTNASKTDSIEIAHILHFRDSSLQGYDTLIVGTDTTFGVWKKQYRYSEVSSNGDTINRAANGPMVPTLFLNNTDGCNARSAQLLNVGFLNRYWFEDDDPTCEELPVFIEDSIRYWQYGEEDPYTYPIKEIAFWQDPLRYSNNIEYHEVDWDSSDGVWNPERSIVLAHQYYNPGNYVITIVAKDSMGCRDTTYLNKEVTAIEVDYSYEQEPCEGIVDFTDQTILSSPSETMTAWTWDFGDGTRKSAITNPTHTYTEPGYFDVNLITWSKFGCVDSIVKTIAIDGPIPLFEYANTSTSVFDTLEIYKSDSLFLTNLSKSINLTNNRFYMEWGDGDVSVPGTMQPKFGHKYQNTGYYMLVLNMEGSAIDGNRCRRSFPDSTNPDHKNVVVHVLPDSTNNISEIERNVMVYPVPADNKLYVKLPPNLNAQDVSVLDMHGKLLKTTTAYESNTFVVDISLLPTGTYVLQLQTEKGIITKRIMIMK